MVQLTSPIKRNPNATVGAGGGFLAVFITWLAGNVFHWNISAEGGAIIAAAISTVALGDRPRRDQGHRRHRLEREPRP